MPSVTPLRKAALAQLAPSPECDGGMGADVDLDGAVYVIEADAVCCEPAGILDTSLRAKLDAIDRDYASILTRLDRMAAQYRAMKDGGKTRH